jgi:hypothetical protein
MYETPDWIEIVRDAAVVLAFLAALVASLTAVGKYFIVKPLERYIDERTPRNGGKSLGELHTKVDTLGDRISRIETEIVRLDTELEAI